MADGVAAERAALQRLFALADMERGVGWGRPGVDERWGVASAGIVCVTGSLALVGEARDELGLPVVERLWS